ncbi:hypothetical protein LAZ67_11001989 [Cordylochernes scorpioides]|uniref:Uncharacterized protein n=1 Tax=Cordylochernes scorpioides TaxID=51811 RepID=A0ABY6L3P9_9ARAC|nr:hypothetical protein LAZ67_11001989 [Cordylochernes scorpioides]
MPHPAFSPELAPSYFYLFVRLHRGNMREERKVLTGNGRVGQHEALVSQGMVRVEVKQGVGPRGRERTWQSAGAILRAVCWRIIVVEDPRLASPQLRPFLPDRFPQSPQNSQVGVSSYCRTLLLKFMMNDALVVEEHLQHDLDFSGSLPRFFWSRLIFEAPLRCLLGSFRIKAVNPCFVSSNDPLKQFGVVGCRFEIETGRFLPGVLLIKIKSLGTRTALSLLTPKMSFIID